MSEWRATKARRVLAALLRIGWRVKRQTGSHRVLEREGWLNVVFAFHDGLLLVASEPGEAVRKRVGNTEFHHLTLKIFITSSPR